MERTLFIKTYGCQMNDYDSTKMADALKLWGYHRVDEASDARVIIVNTCHIREKATEKLYSDLGRYARIKMKEQNKGRPTALVVAGCVSQAHGGEIARRAPAVDIILGPQTIHRLPEMIKRWERVENIQQTDVEFPVESKFDFLPVEPSETSVSALLSIQEGCDKFCTFCCVPYTRGAEESRPVDPIIQEAQALVEGGAVEIMLLGQNVNAYHGVDAKGHTKTLGQLIHILAERVPGLKRIRYTTSHPRDVENSLIEAHRDVPQLMPWLHLPVQSGSDPILKKMNRKHTAADYRRIIDQFRHARSDIAISSDFIVGFPGETDDDFQATCQLVQDVQYAQSFSFIFSPRPGTPAAQMTPISDEVSRERLSQLQDILKTQQRAFNQKCLGETVEVLFDRKGRQQGQWLGKTPYMQSVYIQDTACPPPALCHVVLKEAYDQSLLGGIQKKEAPACSA